MPRRTRPPAAPDAGAPPAISDAEFTELAALLREHAGFHLTPGKKPLLAARLVERMRALGLTSYSEYHRLAIEKGSAEVGRMIDAVITNETRFFRDAEQLVHIEDHLIPAWLAEPPRRIRVWSAGCSSGEEPFSVAMLLLSRLPVERGYSIEVLGTDISSTALDKARAARWPASRMTEVPEAYRRRFFVTDPRTGESGPTPELRNVVRFLRLNLWDWHYPVTGKFDLILCRNVLIYLDVDARADVARRLVERLSPKGALVLGMSESLAAVRDRSLHPQGAEQQLAPELPPLRVVGPAVYMFGKARKKKF